MAADKVRIVAFKRGEQRRLDVAAVSPFQDGEIPGIVAVDAAIDQLDVNALAIGIDAEFPAALIRLEAAAAIAIDERSRRDCGRNRPADT
ncbi:hypothetical protein [Mesorhizobium sp. CA4]|uniref:hypothetical protein n=1 Tax=Mesorhizobium sp. CA4 TaxID=588499 RepID=UPI00398D00B1